MKYNPQIHHRRSIRLKGYDYSQAGLYFVTICCKDRACLFGKIINGEMVLNDVGLMIQKWYGELENKFPDIECHEHIVMPNHFHCIVVNNGTGNPNANPAVGADLRVFPNDLRVCPNDLRVCPDDLRVCPDIDEGEHIGSPQRETTVGERTGSNTEGERTGSNTEGERTGSNTEGERTGSNTEGEHVGSPLHGVVQWFKTMTTNEYIRGVKTLEWKSFNGKLWQRNYYEHIIRNQQSYQTISDYIVNNPAKWNDDKFFLE